MFRKYDKILNKGFKLHDFKDTGLVVQEKLDGANASFTYDEELGKLRVFSRNTELNEHNTLNGFYGYAQEFYEHVRMNLPEHQSLLGDYIFYGEWLTPHKVKYKDEALKKFYLFDMFSLEDEYFLNPYAVQKFATIFGLQTPETFKVYETEDLQETKEVVILDNIKTFLGKSNLTVEPNKGEGIVIKSLTGKQHTHDEYYKLVTNEFKEIMGVKEKPQKPKSVSIVEYAVTPARLEKLIYKKIDEGLLSEDDLTLESFNKVMGTIVQDFQDDIFEEEMETLIKTMRNQIARQVPNLLRPFLESKDRENSDL